MGFCGPNDLSDSVKALKEVVGLRIGLNPTRRTWPCYWVAPPIVSYDEAWRAK